MARRHKQAHEEELYRVYDFVRAYIEQRNRPPTQREIADGTFLSRSVIIRYLDILAERGLIDREIGIARGIGLPKDP